MGFSIFPPKNGHFGGFYDPPGVPSRAPLRCFHVTRRWPVAAGPRRRRFAARSFWWRWGDRWRNAAAWWPREGWGWVGGKNIIFSCIVLYLYYVYMYVYIYIRIYIWEFCIGKWRIYWKTMWEMILLTQGMEWANRFSDHEKTWETHVYFDDGWWMVGMGLAERTSNDKTGMLGNIVGGLEWRLVCQWHGIRCRVLWLGEPICDTVRSSSHLLFFWFLDAQNCTSPVFVNMFPHFSHTFPQFPPTTFPIFGGWFLSHLWRTRAPPLCWRSLPASSPPGGSCHV